MMREGDTVSAADKDLWEYFATLYKHSNKGIKGRGKDQRMSTASEDGPIKLKTHDGASPNNETWA